ncbi:GTP-binding protein [Oleiagrimonas soli]|uniref:Tr-type G domain-containing protein n=1 Tax=Oleiagrimonas soli TaxID=1543381 RepID=A0A099CV05_9GAMM|nr:GTP-binding protein [Oleiagrimonas soli]KGI77491.1 hypothetical protein LF63_0109095 [Oleiagrimonas soli]MBB6183050.1 hypothetical protein [Oleiagrimonas soli]
MKEYKIVVLGSMGAGKSTLVRAVAAGNIVDTDVANTDPDSDKRTTTVALDYADIALPGGDRLRLYGAPGQTRFEFVWPTLLRGAAGVVLMVDATREPLDVEVERYLRVAREAGDMPIVVGLSRLDLVDGDPQDVMARADAVIAGRVPLAPVDARSEEQVLMLMDVLVSEIESAELMGYA